MSPALKIVLYSLAFALVACSAAAGVMYAIAQKATETGASGMPMGEQHYNLGAPVVLTAASRSGMPPIDASAPTKTETATFAMG